MVQSVMQRTTSETELLEQVFTVRILKNKSRTDGGVLEFLATPADVHLFS